MAERGWCWAERLKRIEPILFTTNFYLNDEYDDSMNANATKTYKIYDIKNNVSSVKCIWFLGRQRTESTTIRAFIEIIYGLVYDHSD